MYNAMGKIGAAVINVLLIEDDPADAATIRTALAEAANGPFHIEWVSQLDEALQRLSWQHVDVVLLALDLPDAHGTEVVERVFQAAPHSLILILCDESTEEAARQAVQYGAQDFFSKSRIDTYWLSRALRYAISCKVRADEICQSVAWFRDMNDASPLGILISDTQGRCVYTNPAYQRLSGLSAEEMLGEGWLNGIHPDDRERILAEWPGIIDNQQPFQAEFRFLHGNGDIVWAHINAAAMHDGNKLQGFMQTVDDLTETKSAKSMLEATEEALFEEKQRAQITLDAIGDGVITTDVNDQVTYLNPAAESMTGWPLAEALGRPLAEVFHLLETVTLAPLAEENAEKPAQALRSSMLQPRGGTEFAIEDSVSSIHDIGGQTIGRVIVFRDVSAAHEMAAKMAHLAQHDFLTDLPNRMLFNDRLSQAIILAQRHEQKLALLFMDLDHFKHINDTLGHSIGDLLLKQVSVRLKACIRNADTLCRQGGDEFVVLLSEVDDVQDAAQVATKMLDSFTEPVRVDGHEIDVGLSIGISIYPDNGRDADTIIKNADIAMYHAKENGRNNYQFFTPELNVRAVKRHALKHNLHRAMEREEFLLHYQSRIDLETGQLTGVEALLRWHHPEQGFIEPARFIGIAEDSGLIGPIGQWVLKEACGQMQAWHMAGLPIVPVSVNISAAEFRNKNFVPHLAAILQDTGLQPEFLELELTEGVMLRDIESTTAIMNHLKDMGIRLSIDDFGTGYSNLGSLKHFPIDTLKIDRSFVHDITMDMDATTIVRTIVSMAKSLRLRAIAEGVETSAHLAFLQALQCDEGQGYFFSRPIGSGAFEAMLGHDTTLQAGFIAH